MIPYFKSSDRAFTLLHGDCIELLKQFSFKFDMIFADPPYFLSNGGISVQSGKMVCVDKGEWDKGGTPEYIDSFNRAWISECQNKLKENGTIWISGTYHNIFSIANILTELGFKILNVVTWAKTNPPPNISCRYFTHSTEFIIWARKSAKITHYYNYSIMKQINSNKQMTDVWQLPAIARWGKIMWQTSYSETLICIVAYYFGINSWWCVDSRPIYRQQHYRNCSQSFGTPFFRN